MKKILLFSFSFMAALMVSATPYGIMVNGTDAHEGTQNPTPGDPSFEEWMVLDITLEAGDYVQLYDVGSKATWAVDLDKASVAGISRDGNQYNVTTAGCYSFYIKLKYQQDQLYVGQGDCEGPGPDPGPQPTSDHAWYYKGWIDKGDVEPSEATKFDHGMVEFACSDTSYLLLIYQEDGVPGVQYMTQSYVAAGVTNADFYSGIDATGNKWQFLPGTYTLYLYEGTVANQVTLSTEIMPGRKLIDEEVQAVEQVSAATKAVKFIENGEIRIRRGNNIYDVTGTIIR